MSFREPERRRQQYQARKAAGLCTNCGKPRDGASVNLCAACQIKQRDAARRYEAAHADARKTYHHRCRQQKHARRRAANLCPVCGKAAPALGVSRCPSCNARQAKIKSRYKDRRRRAAGYTYTGDPKTYPYTLGRDHIKPLAGRVQVTVLLDAWAYLAVSNVIRDTRERARAEGGVPKRDQLSRIIRQHIRAVGFRTCPVHRQTDQKDPHPLTILLDAHTFAIVNAHARRHYPRPDGTANRSKALRDFLIAIRPPRQWVAIVGGPRRHRAPDDPWD